MQQGGSTEQCWSLGLLTTAGAPGVPDPRLEAAFCSVALGQETSEAARTLWICFHSYAIALLLIDLKKKKKNLKQSLDQEELFPSDLAEKETEPVRLSVLPKVTRQLESGKAGTGTLIGRTPVLLYSI